jgi:hypothetical protein
METSPVTCSVGRAGKRPETEAGFLQAVRQLARLYNWREYHTYDARHSSKGFPDLCLCRPPRLIFAELKSARGRVTPEQDAWLQDLARVPGVAVFIWRPSDWPAIDAILKGGAAAGGCIEVEITDQEG